MANVKFNRKEFEKYVKITKEIEEKIAMFGTPIESLNSEEIEIEVFPNRPDLLSLQGYLRSFLNFIGKKREKGYRVHKSEKNFIVKIEKSVKNVRPYTACAIVKNLNFNDEKIKEVIDIQEKIHSTLGRNRKRIAIGIYPFEKIKLPIKFEARKPQEIKFVPLEADKEMNGLQILQQHPTGIEYAHLLEGKEKFPVFVDSSGEILSMPPIINSNKTGKITENTKEVFIECSGFDMNLLKKTLNILVTMLADMKGEIYQMKLVYDKLEITPDLTPEKFKLSINNTNKLLGLNLKENEVKKFLEGMGHIYKKGVIEVPAWRIDVMHEVDLIEDIAIAYGYENFHPETSEIATIGEEDEKQILRKKIAEILIGLNFLELSTHHLTNKEQETKSLTSSCIEVENSKTEFSGLRDNLFSSIIKVLGENIDSEYPQKVFEIGKIFNLDKNEETSTSKLHTKKSNFDGTQNFIDMGNSGVKEEEHLIITTTPSNFTEIKQISEYIVRMLEKQISIKPFEDKRFIEGRCGKILYKKENKEIEIGIIGEVHPQVLKNWHLKLPVALAEIDITNF